MRKKIRYLWAMVIFAPGFLFFLHSASSAETFDLTYVLTEGGSRLEMNSPSPEKGVTLNVTSDVACRYEIYHKVTQPLINRDNPSIDLRDNFVVRGIRGVNRYGTFYIPTNNIPVRDNELLYVSNTSGNADSMTLVYGISNLDTLPAGYYQGQIAFTLRPVGVARQEVTKYLYVYVEINAQAGREPTIEIVPVSGTRIIRLSPKNADVSSSDVEVRINGDFNKLFSIAQFLPQGIESPDGSRVDYSLVSIQAKEARRGIGISKSALSPQPQDIYTSGPRGESDDDFIITYSLGDFSNQKAGRYTARIQYILNQAGLPSKILETLELQIENEKVFDLLITPENQKGTLEFLNLRPGEAAKRNEVLIEVKTNTGKQYQVMQKVFSDLTDKEGNVIPSSNFMVHTEAVGKMNGVMKAAEDVPVAKGEMPLYISDTAGSPDRFKIIYELTCPQEAKAGDYSTRIVYSLLEI